jgi:hypothetical protein
MLSPARTCLFALLALCWSCGSSGGDSPPAPENQPPLVIPGSLPATPGAQGGAGLGTPAASYPAGLFDHNLVTRYGATPDDDTDDTEALRRALTKDWDADLGDWVDRVTTVDHYYGRPKTIFIPAGRYLISEPLTWVGCCVSLIGAGPGQTILELPANSSGFDNASNPQALITTPAGNHSFRQNIHGLTIHIRSGNPGAIALDYVANNSGAVTEVEIKADTNSGHTGLAMTRYAPGPCLIKDLTITGFAYGIRVGNPEYGPTFENIILTQQRTTAISNQNNILALRRISIDGPAPGIINSTGNGSVMLLDSVITGTGSGPAIDSEGALFVRNVTTSQVSNAIRIRGEDLPGLSVTEYVDGATTSVFTSPNTSLHLPIADTPRYRNDDLNDWVAYSPSYYGDRNALDTALQAGKGTVYFSPGSALFHITDDRVFRVPKHVRRIIGFHSVVNNNGTAGLRLLVDEASTEPLVIERFGYGVTVVHAAQRPVVIKHGAYHYEDRPGAGDVWFDDVQLDHIRFTAGQRIWARQLNTEGDDLHLDNIGSQLWVMGIKTERKGTVIRTTGGGSSEMIGTLLYPLAGTDTSNPAFIVDNGALSMSYGLSHYSGPNIEIHVRETRDGETREFSRTDPRWTGRHMRLFTAYPADAPRVATPLPSVSAISADQ